MPDFIFGKRSSDNLAGVHADLRTLAERAIVLSEVDFAVIEGIRTVERQSSLLLAGASQTMQSKHIIGHAIDVAAWVMGKPCWDWVLYPKIARAFQSASRELCVPVVWGAIWDRSLAPLTDSLDAEVGHYKARRKGKAFIDAGHFELRMETGITT